MSRFRIQHLSTCSTCFTSLHNTHLGEDVTQRPVGIKTLTTICEVFLDISHISAPPKKFKKILIAFSDGRGACERLVKNGIITARSPWSIKGPFQNTVLHSASFCCFHNNHEGMEECAL